MVCFTTVLYGQEEQVWPGDVDNNGYVDGADLLRWGYAFGRRGYIRPEATIAWTGQPMGQAWPDTFPDGTNLAFADMDGDGRVLSRDLTALFNNQYRTRVPAQTFSDFVLPDTTGNHEASLSLRAAGINLTTTGIELLLEVVLTGRDSALTNFHGIAFNASFTPGTFPEWEKHQLTTAGGFGGDFGNSGVYWVKTDSLGGTLSFTFTEGDHQPHRAEGALLRLSIPLAEGFVPDSLTGASIIIDSLIVHDPEMRQIVTAADTLTFSSQISCNFSVAPVCGIDGVTYLNSCFAEAAGVTVYTAGPCWSPGLDYTAMNPGQDCPTAYEPVCGFNGVTYENACEAEAAGVLRYTAGICSPGGLSCYDPGLIVISGGTSTNMSTGVISLVCTDNTVPVCGCDGEQYASACMAEASGIRSYVAGNCNNGCIDVSQITDNEDCGTETEFVCGCNDQTYINACFAEAAGVVDYTLGACNGTSNWCDEATVISCGDYLPNETTIGAGNQLTSYPGATGVLMQGTDRVYVFEKTSAGDLQIGLEIITPGLNMDLFLLTGDCNNYQVVGSSTYSNNLTNNEGIVVEDAPNGTYYIVVDAPFAGPGGDYRLELSCGYLDCSNRVPLSCGINYTGTNAGGADDVSTYSCGNTLNVENNGPEIVHSFTITESGPVSIYLSGLSANLELFLLDECSRRSCLAYSQNPGTNPEAITRTLPAGTYFVVIDGYNGAVSDYTLLVDCSASCGMEITQTDQVNSTCGQATGSITFQATGGSPTFTAHYVGPVCRNATSTSGWFTFNNLPSGTYTAYVEDAYGCEVAFNFTIGSDDGGMVADVTVTDAGCGEPGAIHVNMTVGGTTPYIISLTGDATITLTTSSPSFPITSLGAGTYTILIQDALGCSVSETVEIEATDGGINVTATPVPAGCDGSPGQIYVQAPNGTLPYSIDLNGPVSTNETVNAFSFYLNDLTPGQYALTLTDALACTVQTEVTVGTEGNLDVQVSPTPANCGTPGAALVSIAGGTAPYMINYTGPVSGSGTTNDPTIIINGLLGGTYSFSIWDDNGCDESETVFVADSQGNLDFSVTQQFTGCDGEDSGLLLVINGGTPNYTVEYAGTVSGSITIGGSGMATLDLPAGTYTFTTTDVGGCSATLELVVTGGISSANQQSFAFGGECGEINDIRTLLNGGEGPFDVTVTTDNCPDQNQTFTTNNIIFELTDLPNCTYTISVIDGNGCLSSRTVTIDVDPEAGTLNLTALNGGCDGLGAIRLDVAAGESPFFINWTGPVEGSVSLAAYEYIAEALPAGTYTFTLINNDGCEDTQTITLNNDANLELVSSIVPDDCGQDNQIWVDVFNGTGPFNVEVVSLCDGTTLTEFVSDDVRFELFDLSPCEYQIIVTDQADCMAMDIITIFPAPIDLFDLETMSGECGELSAFNLQITGGRAPFTIELSGPQSENFTTENTAVDLFGLPSGDYTLFVTDSLGCSETEQFTLSNTTTDLELVTSLTFNDCNQPNQLSNDINGGVPPFTVELIRLCDGVTDTAFTTSDIQFENVNLEPCDYKVKVTDAAGCMDMNTVAVSSTNADLVDIEIDSTCNSSGFNLTFIGGDAPYQVILSGPVSGTFNDVAGPEFFLPAPTGDYLIRVISADGCDEMTFMGVVMAGDGVLPTAAFSVTSSGMGIAPVNSSMDALSYAWDFGDGNTSAEATPEHTYAQTGTYTVCLTATNDCGTDEVCQDVTATNGGNIQIVIGGDRSAPGTVARIPISVQGGINLAAMAGTFALAVPELATITHVTAGAILPQFNADNNSFTFVANGAGGIDLEENITVLFFLHLELSDQVGISDIDLINSPLGLEVSGVLDGLPVLYNASYLPGFVESSTNLLGMISAQAYDLNDEVVDLVNFQLSEPDQNYTLNLPEDENGFATTLTGLSLGRLYYVEPLKNTDPQNGLSSFEIFLAQRLLLGDEVAEVTDPRQIVGLDMNCSQSFSTIDLLIMQSLLIGDIAEVPDCNSWTFIPDSHVFPTDFDQFNVFPAPRRAEIMLEGDSTVIFAGVKNGDLLGDADPGRSAGTLPLTVSWPAPPRAGETVELSLNMAEFHDLVSFQGELRLAEGLEFAGVTGIGLPELKVGEHLAERGRLFLSWFSATGEAVGADAGYGPEHLRGAAIVTIAVRVTDAYVDGTLPFAFDYSSSVAAAAHGGQGERYRPEISLLTPEVPAFRLHPAIPNPATEYTDLTFELPAVSEVTLTVMDGLGRPVIRRTQRLDAGANRFRLDTRALPAGTYVYQLVAGADVGGGKVVVR